jgi:flagellar motor switch protein FliN
MEKVLNQEEIDAMVRAARSGESHPNSPLPPRVERWDARRAGQIGREQLQAITTLHEGFARNLTHALGAFLRVVFAAGKVESAKIESAGPAANPAAPPASSDGEENRARLDLLMEVELAVTLRFGSRRLLLREVLDLNPGAVVDLDRPGDEPVDVLVDGRLVARGEVVVMDGNYGVRITEVAPASP